MDGRGGGESRGIHQCLRSRKPRQVKKIKEVIPPALCNSLCKNRSHWFEAKLTEGSDLAIEETALDGQGIVLHILRKY